MEIIIEHRVTWLCSQVNKNDRLLDVGTAENPVWYEYTNIVTVDIDPKVQPDIIADAEQLPIGDKRFDVVCLGEILEHLQTQKALQEAKRIAKKSVLMSVPNEYLWPITLKPFQNPGHVRFYMVETFEEEMKKVGFKNLYMYQCDYHGWSWFVAKGETKEM